MYCYKCGKQVDDDARFCIYCGCELNPADNANPAADAGNQYGQANNQYGGQYQPNDPYAQNQNGAQQWTPPQPQTDPTDKRSPGFSVLSFFFPIVGLILWIIWHEKSPLKARSCAKGAVIGFVLNIILSISMSVINIFLL